MRSTRRARLPVVVVASLLLSGCQIPDQTRPDIFNGSPLAGRPSAVSAPAAPTSAVIRVYFVNGSNQVVAETRSAGDATLSTSIAALLAGPTSQESAAGISSAIPTGTRLDSVHQSGTTAILDFNDALASVSGREQVLAFAQIVVTADSLAAVDRIQVSIAGQVVNAPEPDGTLAQGPVTMSQYASLLAR